MAAKEEKRNKHLKKGSKFFKPRNSSFKPRNNSFKINNNNRNNPKPRPKSKSKSKKPDKNPQLNPPNPNPNPKPTKKTPPRFLVSPSEHREFFIDQLELANDFKFSSLELESIKDTYFVKLSDSVSQEAINLGEHIKGAFQSSWKQTLCEPQLVDGKIDAGNPAVLVISASAIKSLDMLKGLRILTKECQAVKLFSKHIKVEEQVALLKKRVNIASGTPNRIKKLAEMEALGLSRLSVIVLDMHTDVKGYSLFTLPQVRDEFWDLYNTYFHQRFLQGNLRICLYGPTSTASGRDRKKSEEDE